MPAPFAADLLAWFDREAADLPWRADHDPYHVWLSEVMLQQTQIETVKPYYARFLAAYPTVSDLAAAPIDDVLKHWEGLGYYSRARNLHRAAQTVTANGGQFPQTAAALLALPGVGRYTAGAISSIAFDERAPVLDGNVIRVFARLLDLPDDVTQPATQTRLWAQADSWLPDARPGDYNQALMQLGQLVCRPRQPRCNDCPIRAHCRAYQHETQGERPVRTRKGAPPHYDVGAGMVWRDGRVLIAQRAQEGLLGGLWEFPGGKVEPGESLPDCVRRELREELAIDVEVGDLFAVVKHGFTHFSITLHAFHCTLIAGEPNPAAANLPQDKQAQAVAWVTPAECERYAFGKADREIVTELTRRPAMLF